MNLVLDIGNTKVKYALFNHRELVKHQLFNFDESAIKRLLSQHHGPLLISSVIDHTILQSEEKFNSNLLTPSTPLPLKNSYQSPETLGNDRLANAAAIHFLSHAENSLSVDCGTCLKIDLVIKEEYVGGSISPGLAMRLKSLHNFTGKLPLIEPEQLDQLIGKNTRESILSGCYRGMLAEIKQTLNDFENEFGSLKIFFTGGDHGLFADHFKNRIFADPFLTLKGLNEILLFQQK